MKHVTKTVALSALMSYAAASAAFDVTSACKHAVGRDDGTIILVGIACKTSADCAVDFPRTRIDLMGEELTGDADTTVAWHTGGKRFSREAPRQFPATGVLDLSQWQQVKSNKARITVDGQPVSGEFALASHCKAHPKELFETLEITWPLK